MGIIDKIRKKKQRDFHERALLKKELNKKIITKKEYDKEIEILNTKEKKQPKTHTGIGEQLYGKCEEEKEYSGGLTLGSLLPAIAAFIVIGIFAGVGAKILGDMGEIQEEEIVKEEITTNNLTTALTQMNDWAGLLGTIVILGVVIAVVIGVIGSFRMGGI